MKTVQTKSRNGKHTTTKPAPPPPAIDLDRLKAEMDRCRLNEFAELMHANRGRYLVTVAFDYDEHTYLTLASGQSEEGNIEDFIKVWALTAAHNSIEEIAVGLRDKKLKLVEVTA